MIPVSDHFLAGRERDYVLDCIDSGWISSAGAYVERFERAWADYCGVKHGIAVSSGTAALQIAMDALGLDPGDEVIMPSFTYISCALAAIRSGAKPVLIDCDPDTWCMDVDQVAAALTSRTRAIMPVHIYGHPVAMGPVLDLARQKGLAVIEDACEAHGSEIRISDSDWRRCGGLGTLAAFSFYGNKLVTTGDGGMVLTNDDGLAERCSRLRNQCVGARPYTHTDLGYNFRLSALQAAVGLAQTEDIARSLAGKREIAARYDQSLDGVRQIARQQCKPWARSNHWMYGIVVADEARVDGSTFSEQLRQRGVDTRPFFTGLHEQPALHGRGLIEPFRMPVTERLSRQGVCLPSGPRLTSEQIDTVARTIGKILS